MSVNGPEFDNVEVISFLESHCVQQKFTSAEQPWQNGVCERKIQYLKEIATRVFHDMRGQIEAGTISPVETFYEINAALNETPSVALGGRTPFFVDTGRPAAGRLFRPQLSLHGPVFTGRARPPERRRIVGGQPD